MNDQVLAFLTGMAKFANEQNVEFSDFVKVASRLRRAAKVIATKGERAAKDARRVSQSIADKTLNARFRDINPRWRPHRQKHISDVIPTNPTARPAAIVAQEREAAAAAQRAASGNTLKAQAAAPATTGLRTMGGTETVRGSSILSPKPQGPVPQAAPVSPSVAASSAATQPQIVGSRKIYRPSTPAGQIPAGTSGAPAKPVDVKVYGRRQATKRVQEARARKARHDAIVRQLTTAPAALKQTAAGIGRGFATAGKAMWNRGLVAPTAVGLGAGIGLAPVDWGHLYNEGKFRFGGPLAIQAMGNVRHLFGRPAYNRAAAQ